jgi:uncharacterized membrane protein YgcG
MSKTIRITLATLVVAGLALSAASTASARTLRGTVVHRNARAHSFTLASRRGHLSAIHSRRTPRLGRAVRVRARRLRDGTYLALRVRGRRLRRHARLRGTVTFRRRSRRLFVLSARGVSLVVHRRHRRVRGASNGFPRVGHDVTVRVGLHHGELEVEEVNDHGEDTGTVELEGVVQAVDVDGRTLSLSADDEDESGGTITVLLPDGFDPASYHVGDEVEFVATLNADGTYTAVSSSDEDNAEEADDSSDDQGEDSDDQGEEHNGSDESGGSSGESGGSSGHSGDDGSDD